MHPVNDNFGQDRKGGVKREGRRMAEVKLAGVNKFYGGQQALHDVTLEIADGEFAVFVGPSGCGKSTLLRSIAGLESISGGTVSIGGRDVSALAPSERDVAMVFQSYALYPHMTVRENMDFGMKINNFTPADRERRIAEAARVLQLEPYLDRKPSQLSGGQRQRVAIGRSIVRDPKVYLFDEPLSNLDAALRVATRIEIAQLKEQMPNSTMIYVTHDQVEAMTLASRIVVLAGGGISQVGAPLELYERPKNEFVAQFIGSPAMNLLPGQVIATGAQTVVRLDNGGIARSAVPTQAADMGLKVNVGVRPEDFLETSEEGMFTGEVEITEALGEVTLLYFKRQGEAAQVVAKLPGIHADLRRKTVTLSAAAAKVHLFANGESLLYR